MKRSRPLNLLGEAERGRGAGANPASRFLPLDYVRDGDSQDGGVPEEERVGVRTEFFVEPARSIIAYNDSPDVGFDAGINPYRGCEHGCIYCFARPTHEYLGLSGGLDFETKVFVKVEAPKLLREELSAKSWRPQVVGFSGVTDCYQPVERRLGITRKCLEVLAEFRNPVAMITKNHLVTRDVDVLSEMAKLNLAAVNVSLTTLDKELSSRMEPRASVPSRRLEAVEALSRSGVPVGVLMGPMIPGLTDHEVPGLLRAAKAAGARWAHMIPLRLPGVVAPLFEEWLGRWYPDRKERVLNRVRAMRGGKLYEAGFHTRMSGVGETYEQVVRMFEVEARRLGLDGGAGLTTEHFRVPARGGQMELFG